jgi:hypothetical protein
MNGRRHQVAKRKLTPRKREPGSRKKVVGYEGQALIAGPPGTGKTHVLSIDGIDKILRKRPPTCEGGSVLGRRARGVDGP